MNSYPPELLTQLAPVMFVAGLDVQSTQQQDSFTVLTSRLREALFTRKTAIYQPEKTKSFHVVFVDKSVRFPPRKITPDDPQYLTAHSPLSPLTPTSPLFPDGLIAPIWIRKHTTLVPSVFVLFLRIFELQSGIPRSPLDPPDPDREREKADEERRKDAELAEEIAQRKKSTNERGIKLTVVLMATRRMLDDPSLDARLTFIRRQSGLDSRAALFVLSPVSSSELGDFVQSLQQALYEPAVEYYTNHSKRVRRKRNRHAQGGSTHVVNTLPAHSTARPLRPEGWTVRYEYKMACFAEFRGEDEVALKHYQDAYAMLTIMFGSTAILPPRTKRWAEAKVLADCINVKVSKLYLYNNEHALALSHHNTHVRRFADFSRGWGIGEETYEFWSWMARQYRVLGELLEQGTHSTLVIPSHRPNSTTLPPALPASLPPTVQNTAQNDPGMNASHALQHPGYYYHMAARYTEVRRERFLAALNAEVLQTSPGFANEKKVDHLTIILELYTKSYELFKKYSPVNGQNQSQGRLTLWIAYRIAQTYYEAGKFDMAVRFFERIAKTYRREKWAHMLRPLLSTWYSCAQKIGDAELSVRLLVEMLGHGPIGDEDEGTLVDNLLAVLEGTIPAKPEEPLVVDLSEALPIFDSAVVFWTAEVKVGERAAFQVSLTAPTNVSILTLPIAELRILFRDEVKPVVVRHVSGDFGETVRKVDLGHVGPHVEGAQEVQACLRWNPADIVILAGTMSSNVPGSLKISKLVLVLNENSWNIEIPFHPCCLRLGAKPIARWLSSLDPVRFTVVKRDDASTVSVRHRPHRVLVSLDHQSPAYLDEEYPITIDITNADNQELDIVVDVLLQPTEIDHAVNSIVLGEERSSGLIKGVPFGVIAPGVNVMKTLYLFNSGAPGNRMIDISIRSRSKTSLEQSSDGFSSELEDASETLQTLVVPTVEPIKFTFDVVYRRTLDQRRGLADLTTFEETFWDDGDGGEAVVDTRMECTGPWSLEVANVRLVNQAGKHAEVIENFLSEKEKDMFPADYLPGDEFCDVCRITLAPPSEPDDSQISIPGPGMYEIDWRRIMPNSERGPLSTTRRGLPPLRPPMAGLVAQLSVPPTAKLHVPISMHLTICNHHPTRSANITVQLEPDPSDGFVVAGLRVGRVPILLPGAEERLTWRLIPLECGYVNVPRLKVIDRRKAIASSQGIEGANAEVDTIGEVVSIIDVRRDERGEDGEVLRNTGEGASTVLVTP